MIHNSTFRDCVVDVLHNLVTNGFVLNQPWNDEILGTYAIVIMFLINCNELKIQLSPYKKRFRLVYF